MKKLEIVEMQSVEGGSDFWQGACFGFSTLSLLGNIFISHSLLGVIGSAAGMAGCY